MILYKLLIGGLHRQHHEFVLQKSTNEAKDIELNKPLHIKRLHLGSHSFHIPATLSATMWDKSK